MIKRKTAYGSVGADTIKMMKDGVEVEIEKVISYDAGGAQTENEIFPNALTFVEISTNYDDERTDEVPEPLIEDYWQRHNMPNVNIALPSHTSDPFTINVDVYPSNAEWYFETQYLNSDEVLIGPYYIEGITHNGTTPIIYKGSQTFIDVLPELATETYIDVQLDVKPKKGSLSNRAVLWFRQTREDIIISDFASKFDFNNAILQSTDGTLNTYTNFFNDNYAGAETPEFREVRYDSETLTSHLGLVIADFNDSRYQAVEQVYSTEFGGGYDFGLAQVQSAALRESGIYYEIDMDAAIPDRWYDGGFSVSYVVDPTDVLKGFQAGFLENYIYDYRANSRIPRDTSSVLLESVRPGYNNYGRTAQFGYRNEYGRNIPVSFFESAGNGARYHSFVNDDSLNSERVNVVQSITAIEDITQDSRFTFDFTPNVYTDPTTRTGRQSTGSGLRVYFTYPEETDKLASGKHSIQYGSTHQIFSDNNWNISLRCLVPSQLGAIILESYVNGFLTSYEVKVFPKTVDDNAALIAPSNPAVDGDAWVYPVIQPYTLEYKYNTNTYGLVAIADRGTNETWRKLHKPGFGNFTVMCNNEAGYVTKKPALEFLGIKNAPMSSSLAQNETKSHGLDVYSYAVTDVPAVENVPNSYTNHLDEDINALQYTEQPIDNVYIKPMIVDNRMLCVGAGFTNFFIDQMNYYFPHSWKDSFNKVWHDPGWALDFRLSFTYGRLAENFFPRIVEGMDDINNWSVRDITDTQNPVDISISMKGRMAHANKGHFFNDVQGILDKEISVTWSAKKPEDMRWLVQPLFSRKTTCDINQYAYVELSTALVEGNTYEVTWTDPDHGTAINTGTFTAGPDVVSRSIKVNQVGYLNDSTTSKFGYLGNWLGWMANNDAKPDATDLVTYPGGSSDAQYIIDLEAWNTKTAAEWYREYDPTLNPDFDGTYEVYSTSDYNTPVYTGTTSPRGVADRVWQYSSYKVDTDETILGVDVTSLSRMPNQRSGEITYDFNFADINVPDGEYQVYIPGIGWSWKFKLGNEPAMEGFYVMMKGMYHQRSGTTHQAPYTYTECPAAITQAYEIAAPGNLETWGSGAITNSTGIPQNFTNIEFYIRSQDDSLNGKRHRGVYGGYHDAADFDMRHYHMPISGHLAMMYILEPEKYADNQLNIPESGDGIPDILSEADWGHRCWRLAQDETGMTTSQIEAEGHADGTEGAISSMRYSIHHRDVASTLQYIPSAARLARAYALVDTPEAQQKAAMWEESARRAFEVASDPANLVTNYQFTLDGVEYFYTENYDYAYKTKIYAAAVTMYCLTREPKYATFLTDEFFHAWFDPFWKNGIGDSSWRYHMTELAVDNDLAEIVPEHCDRYRRAVTGIARMWEDVHNKSSYRGSSVFAVDDIASTWDDDKYSDMGGSVGNSYVWQAFSTYGGNHPSARSGIPTLEAYRAAKWGNNDPVEAQRWLSQLQTSYDWMAGAREDGRGCVVGLGKTYPNAVLDYRGTDRMVQDGVYEHRMGISPYEGNKEAEFFSGFGGITFRAISPWGCYLEGRSDFNFETQKINCMPGGYRERFGVAAANGILRDNLKKMLPYGRYNSSVRQSAQPMFGEYTVWETIIAKAMIIGSIAGYDAQNPWTPGTELTDFQYATSWYKRKDGTEYEPALCTP